MIPKLTHTEACRLVEDALERIGRTLAYVRLQLAQDPNYLERSSNERILQSKVDEANLICNINWYGAYLQGARRMALALEEWDLLDFPPQKISYGKHRNTVKRAAKPVSKAIFDLFMENTRNLEWCLHGLPGDVGIFTRDKLDSKGKVIGKKAFFGKKEVNYKEI